MAKKPKKTTTAIRKNLVRPFLRLKLALAFFKFRALVLAGKVSMVYLYFQKHSQTEFFKRPGKYFFNKPGK
jgi:hypothetical protein